MLGWRRCTSDGLTCGVAQPVAGPLASRAAGGMRLRIDGAVLTVVARARAASGAGAGGALDSSIVVLRSRSP
jgi:hypothetical protein